MTVVPLTIREPAGVARTREVVSLGVPLPQGLAHAADVWEVESSAGERLACQTAPLALWPDGSVKWLRVAFPATVPADESAQYRLIHAAPAWKSDGIVLRVEEFADRIEIRTGSCLLRLPRRGDRLIDQVHLGDSPVLDGDGVQLRLVDEAGTLRTATLDNAKIEEAGPLRARVAFTGRFPKSALRIRGAWTLRAGSDCAQLEVTLHNPLRARHQRGLWDLGDPGSVLLRSLSLEVPVVGSEFPELVWCEQPRGSWSCQSGGRVQVVQHSSGGSNDASRNHVNRHGEAPARGQGYVVRSAAGETHGMRASAIGGVQVGNHQVVAGIAEFWQRFPASLELAGNTLRLGILPASGDEQHELQGGEQCTTRVAIGFGRSQQPDVADLMSVLAPLEVRCDWAWAAASGAVWRLPQSAANLRGEWQQVSEQAIGGEQGFFAKREIADEYGWRNFGDLWADHEEAYYKGPQPIVSHYNNQYDALEAFLLCYLLTGERRWWELADPLARHIIDIDIYHTTQDKASYNNGLFWHTNHYVDAVTSTHRAYSRVNHPAGGGGPSNEHNYTSGLLLYHQITGNRQAREAVIGLAEWVLQMDDGRRHILGLVHETPTGMASQTSQTTFHGPGRGAGNSLNALLDGWLASGRPELLDKVEELVRRTIHPHDDIAALDLANAELRWSYTVFLQSLVRLLALAEECRLDAELQEYARSSLLHYARWMAEHEVFYLDRPEKLEFPTETWAAQELRKANVLTAAALYASAAEAEKFRGKAKWFYDRAWSSLLSCPTWRYTRPTVLALQLGLSAAQLAGESQRPPIASALAGNEPLAPRSQFVPQKEAVRRRMRSPVQLLAMVVRLGRVWRWPDVWRTTWVRQRIHRFWGHFIG